MGDFDFGYMIVIVLLLMVGIFIYNALVVAQTVVEINSYDNYTSKYFGNHTWSCVQRSYPGPFAPVMYQECKTIFDNTRCSVEILGNKFKQTDVQCYEVVI